MLIGFTKAERIVKEYIAGETVYTLVLKDALPETCLRQVQAMCRLLRTPTLTIFPLAMDIHLDKKGL